MSGPQQPPIPQQPNPQPVDTPQQPPVPQQPQAFQGNFSPQPIPPSPRIAPKPNLLTKTIPVKPWQVIAGFIAVLVVGALVGAGCMYLYATPVVNSAQQSAADWKKKYDGQKKLNDFMMEMYPQSSSGDTNDDSSSNDSSNNDVTGIGSTAVSGGIEMKVLEAGDQPSISFDTCGDGCSNGQYAPKAPDANTKYWVAKVEVKNNTSRPLDITCGYPYEIVALNSKSQHYTPIQDLYQVEGNPECNAQLQPGLTSTVIYPFQVPADAQMVAIAFRDVGDILSGESGEDEYAYIVTDENYKISH